MLHWQAPAVVISPLSQTLEAGARHVSGDPRGNGHMFLTTATMTGSFLKGAALRKSEAKPAASEND